MADTKVLINTRKSLKLRLKRIQSYVFEKYDEEESIENLNIRLDRLEEIWTKFDMVQSQLEDKEPDLHEIDRETVEEQYFLIKSKITEYLKEDKKRDEERKQDTNIQQNNMTERNDTTGKVKLPKINIPIFDGKYENWNRFYEAFLSLIDNNNSISGIEKLMYLQSSLQGEPLKVITSETISVNSYEESLQLLKERYDKKNYIVNAHIKALFDIPVIGKNQLIDIRTLITETKQHLRALKALTLQIEHWDPLIIYLLTQKLDKRTREAWSLQKNDQELPMLDELLKFLEHRCGSLEFNNQQEDHEAKPKIQYKRKNKSFHVIQENAANSYNDPNNNSNKFYKSKTIKYICKLCNKNHYLFHCDKFLRLNTENKISTVKNYDLCVNCLKPNHSIKECYSRRCNKCGKKRNTLLHLNQMKLQEEHSGEEAEKENKTAMTCYNSTENKQILLATVILKVKDSNDQWQNARALLDSGSQSNFGTTDLIKRLNIKTSPTQVNLSGINNKQLKVNSVAHLKIKSRVSEYQTNINVLVMDNITTYLPHKYIESKKWNISSNLPLADPEFYESGQIDILIGAEIYFELLKQEQIKLGIDLPVMQNTHLGWIVSGQIKEINQNKQTTLFVTTNENLDTQLEKFWKMENIPNTKIKTQEEKDCDMHFKTTTTRNKEGRYVVKIPLNENKDKLGDSWQRSLNRYKSLQKRLHLNEDLNKQYCSFMTEYENLGHMEKITNQELETNDAENKTCYYIPHHAVIKEDSTTTKLRVVFNASMKTDTKYSLNDIMKSPPTVGDELFNILLRFRLHKIAFIADIEKMYRQILIDPDQCDLQRIIWQDQQGNMQVFRLKTITYGTSAAPYLATKTLRQLAIDEGDAYPLAKQELINNFYVDDVMTGCNTINEALQLQKELIELLNKGKFNLRKWCSNCKILLESIEPDKIETQLQLVMGKKTIKALGLLWIPGEDKLKFLIHIKDYNFPTNTKIRILSEIASIYDPLGLLSPIIVKAKLFIQELWKIKVDWDDELDEKLIENWVKFKTQLKELQNYEIDRKIINLNSNDLKYELHGFCDSSQIAYGACVYLKCTDKDNNISVKLICAKSRVAPIKPITLPRLELCGAVVLARLQQKVCESLQININSIYLWTDSTIVLHWIAAEATRWKLFVANRVSEIQELTSNCTWNHISTLNNPADYLTRGLNAEELQSATVWWLGPQLLWITENYNTTNSIDVKVIDPEILEEKPITSVNLAIVNISIINTCSTLLKAKRVLAYCLRFLNNCKPKQLKQTGHLNVIELDNSFKSLIKNSQAQEFQEEIKLLTNNQEIKKGKLKNLTPFLDKEGIIRVGGRLEYLPVDYNRKHPIILPSNHRLTELIIEHEHIKLYHGGAHMILGNLREGFWPLRGRNTVKRIIHKCVQCYRLKSASSTQLMGNLPSFRGKISKPFANTGIDYGGPFLLKQSTRRNAPIVKAYIALFVCMVTRAIHIELVSNLNTEAFLNALRRFIARRGVCTNIYSDNATNFKGAKRQLHELYILFQEQTFQTKIINFCANQEIQWKFIPPVSPHHGGIWEAGIKSVKHHIQRTIGKTKLTYEEFNTILSQIEACVNSRPLCPLSEDPSEYNFVTPSHFLTGYPQFAILEPNLTDTADNRLSQFQFLQKRIQCFWKTWSKDYLNSLQIRSKWNLKSPNIVNGTIILLKEDNIAPCNWVLGRITQVYPSSDGAVRVVKVKTANGEYTRPIVKCCVLPIRDNQNNF